jgi:CheY-like chemotaxis protein
MFSILIVEDDPAIGCALGDDLRLEGYSVELVTDGEAALVRARAGSAASAFASAAFFSSYCFIGSVVRNSLPA